MEFYGNMPHDSKENMLPGRQSQESVQFTGRSDSVCLNMFNKRTSKKQRICEWLIIALLTTIVLICSCGLLVLTLKIKPSPSIPDLEEQISVINDLSANFSKKLGLLRAAVAESSQKDSSIGIEAIIDDLTKEHERTTNMQHVVLNQMMNNITEELRPKQNPFDALQEVAVQTYTAIGELTKNLQDLSRNISEELSVVQDTFVNKDLKKFTKTVDHCHVGEWGHPHDVYGDGKDYYMAFRATEGTELSVYQAYMGGLKHNLEPTCKQVDGSLPCSGHYRNDVILDTWQNIEHVVIALYSKGHLKQSVKFRAAGTNFTSWMSASRLEDAGIWKDLATSGSNHFSIEGEAEKERRFFINQEYSQRRCDADVGWMVVLDPMWRASDCDWAKKTRIEQKYPWFLYSEKSGSTEWSSRGTADVLAIFVKPFEECFV